MPISEEQRRARIVREMDHEAYLLSPEFSRSKAHDLLTRSPKYARARSSKPPTKEMINGSLRHRLLLGVGQAVVVIEADSYRTKKAQEERDGALANGWLPVLEDDFREAETGSLEVRRQIEGLGLDLADFEREVTIFWTPEEGVPCKARFDLVDFKAGRILDPKFVRSLSTFDRSFAPHGYDLQHAAYLEALYAVVPELEGRGRMIFLAIECEDGYVDVAPARPLGMMRSRGELGWRRAKTVWSECLASGIWPGHGPIEVEAKPWELTEELTAQIAQEPDWMGGDDDAKL